MKKKRGYQLKRRAERSAETRRHITEVTVALHQEIGPAATTISKIAERAGVERLTVYRHFPDETSLFLACQKEFRSRHPRPAVERWAERADPVERVTLALGETYSYYRETESMTFNILRDAPAIPALSSIIADIPEYYASARETLVAAFVPSQADLPRLRAASGHALDFTTWRSLVRGQGLSDDEAAGLMVVLICAAARPA